MPCYVGSTPRETRYRGQRNHLVAALLLSLAWAVGATYMYATNHTQFVVTLEPTSYFLSYKCRLCGAGNEFREEIR